MKRIFLIILLVFLVLNTAYKCYVYVTSEKIDGTMVWVAKKAEAVQFFYNGATMEVTRTKWSFIRTLKENDSVVVLVANEGKEATDIEIFTFFQFWFTFYDMILAFSVCFVGTIFLSGYLPEKEEKIEEWK